MYCAIKFVYVVVPQFFVETATSWYRQNDLLHCGKCGSINFQKQKKQPTKYKYMGIAPLKSKRDLLK